MGRIVALLAAGGLVAGWWVTREPLTALPPALLEITGTPGQTFRGIIQTNGRAHDVGGTVPAEFPLGTGRFAVRLWMTGSLGRFTNTVYENRVPRAGAESQGTHERLGFERSPLGHLGINAYPSNAIRQSERPL